MPRFVIGVMGPGEGATEDNLRHAYEVGRLIAQRGCVTLTGGRASGVMDAALAGAKSEGGLTLGILPTNDKALASRHVDIAVVTAMSSARNNINALSSDVVIACGLDAGTLSEVALALKADRAVIILGASENAAAHLCEMGGDRLAVVETPAQAMEHLDRVLPNDGSLPVTSATAHRKRE